MLDGIRSWMKDMLRKARDRPESPITLSPTLAQSAAASAQTRQISFALPPSPSGTRPLRRSEGSPSLLALFDPNRTDASRNTAPSPVTPTQPSCNDMRQTESPSHLRDLTDPKARHNTAPTRRPGPPAWFPSGAITMTSRTTHQTYSTNPSLLFTGPMFNGSLRLSPATTVPTPKPGKGLESDAPVIENPVAPHIISGLDPSAQEQATPPAELFTNVVETPAKTGEIWIKLSVAGPTPQRSAVAGTARAEVMPSITVVPPTPISHQSAVQTITPIISSAVIVDSPEGSVVSLYKSNHGTSTEAVAAHPVEGYESRFWDSEDSDDVQPCNDTAEPVESVPFMGGNDIVRPTDGVDVANVRDVHFVDLVPVGEQHTGSSHSLSYIPLVQHRTQPAASQEFDSRLERQLEGSDSESMSQLVLIQPPPNAVVQSAWSDLSPEGNYMMYPSVEDLSSVVGPHAPPFAPDKPAPTESVVDLPGCRYPALSIAEFLPYRRPELLLPPPAYLSADEELWWTVDYVSFPTVVFEPWQGHPDSDDRLRRYATLGVVSTAPGRINYMVFNRKSGRSLHILTSFSPAGIESSTEAALHSNHLRIMQCLAQLPSHNNLAVYRATEPIIWRCPDEFIWYLSVSSNVKNYQRVLIMYGNSLTTAGLLMNGTVPWRIHRCR
jgi:hypothetical protein